MSKTALITWASSWIGQACAEHLAMEWYDLILLARRTEKLEAIKTELEWAYWTLVDCVTCDVTDYDLVDALAKDIKKPIHVLINSAWWAFGKWTFQESSREDMKWMIEVNILGLVKMAKAFTPHLIEAEWHLVNISSISWVMPYQWWHVYGWAKSFVNQFSNNLRIDFLGTNVRVTDIAPGKVNTEFSLVRFKGDKATADAEYVWFRELKAEDIARSVWFCVTQPPHVNIDYMLVNTTDWARPGFAIKK